MQRERPDARTLRPRLASVLQVLVWLDEDLALIYGRGVHTRVASPASPASPDTPSSPASRRRIGARSQRGR